MCASVHPIHLSPLKSTHSSQSTHRLDVKLLASHAHQHIVALQGDRSAITGFLTPLPPIFHIETAVREYSFVAIVSLLTVPSSVALTRPNSPISLSPPVEQTKANAAGRQPCHACCWEMVDCQRLSLVAVDAHFRSYLARLRVTRRSSYRGTKSQSMLGAMLEMRYLHRCYHVAGT